VVPSNLWGGLLLTFLLTVVGILFSFPLGVLLALGRRSPLPIIRWVSIGYIELIRGVPLVTILFMAQIMLPLFLPAGMTVDRVLRAMVGIILFTAAYQAENIRGGLAAIPAGQYEAAHALGLSGLQTTTFIILPQALRNVIPVLVGQFIALYKDTSLVAIVGLLDLLGIAKSIVSQPQFIGMQREAYLFVTLIYWCFSYVMAYLSQRLEVALGVGER
jgi:general L-amino acid transport system permease protein